MGIIANNVIKELLNLGIKVSYEVLNKSEVNSHDYSIEVQQAMSREYDPHNSIGIVFSYPDIYQEISKLIKTKVFVGYTGCDSTGGYKSGFGNPWNTICNQICDYMLTPSDYSRKIMKNLGVSKEISLFPHGVDLNIFKPFKRNLSKPITFVFTGELTKRKSTQDIIEAFLEFSGLNNPDYKLLLRANSHMKYLQSDQIIELTKKSNNIIVEWKDDGQNDIVNYLNHGHIYLSCTRADWYNMPIFEAMATGCPIIANSTNGYWEYLKDYVIPINYHLEVISTVDHPYLLGEWSVIDKNDLKEKMKYVIQNYDFEIERALRASKYISKEFTWENVTKKYLVPFLEKIEDEHFKPERKNTVENKRVTVGIPTKDRLVELTLLIQSLLNQSYKEFDVLIIDDCNDGFFNNGTLQSLFKLLIEDGHNVDIIKGERIGPHIAGQKILNNAKTELILRLDDDVSLLPTFIEELVSLFTDDKVGAVGPIYLNPNEPLKDQHIDYDEIKQDHFNMLRKVFWDSDGNLFLSGYLQNNTHSGMNQIEVEHLNSGFMYRKSAGLKIGGYCLELSPVGHREESDFSYRLFREGYKLFINPKSIAYHFHPIIGGIRESNGVALAKSNWDHDEKIFLDRMEKLLPKNKTLEDNKMVSVIILTCGEDHKNLRELLKGISEYTNHSCEYILVNNDQRDTSYEDIKKVAEEFSMLNISLLSFIKDYSVSEARNIGVEAAKYKYICFIDDDARILGRYNQTTDWVDYLYNRFHEQPDVGAVGPIFTWCNEVKTYVVSVACMFTSKKVWEVVGGFDPVFGNKEKGSFGYEDTDWSYRCFLRGFKILGVKGNDFPFYHEDTTTKKKTPEREKALIKGRILFLSKYNIKE